MFESVFVGSYTRHSLYRIAFIVTHMQDSLVFVDYDNKVKNNFLGKCIFYVTFKYSPGFPIKHFVNTEEQTWFVYVKSIVWTLNIDQL